MLHRLFVCISGESERETETDRDTQRHTETDRQRQKEIERESANLPFPLLPPPLSSFYYLAHKKPATLSTNVFILKY